MFRYAIPALLMATAILVAGYSPGADDAAPLVAVLPAIVQPPTFTLISAKNVVYGEQTHLSLTFEVVNLNEASLMYTGYEPTAFDPPLDPASFSPIYEIEVLRDSDWQEHPIGWCGTGMGNLELKPHTPVVFSVAVPDDGWTGVKVGFGHDPGWSDDVHMTSTRWSTIIWREEIAAMLSGM